MDIAKLMKMNKLTSELQKHGMADSSEDAFAKAENMVHRDSSETRFSNPEVLIREANTNPEPIKSFSSQQPQQVRPVVQPAPQVHSQLHDPDQKSVIELNAFMKRLHTTVETQTKQIDFLQNKINDMLMEISRLKERPQQAPVSRPETKPEVQATFNIQPKQEKKEETSSPRSGNYTSDDVSIEKVFYMGNK